MPTSAQKSGLVVQAKAPSFSKLGIIAGGGELPRLLTQYCDDHHIASYVIGFNGQTDEQTYADYPHIKTRIGAAGRIFKWIKQNDIKDIVFIGAINRPKMLTLWPDLTAFWFFISKGIWARGDNALLVLARKELEQRGVKLWGVHNFLPDLLTPRGVLTQKDSGNFQRDIALGITHSQQLGAADIGQAVIVKDGQIIGLENEAGTNALIDLHGQAGAVLVKTCKPQQDKDLDLPTIGVGTIKACAAKNMAGIAVHAGQSLIVNRAAVIRSADEHDLFIVGVDV